MELVLVLGDGSGAETRLTRALESSYRIDRTGSLSEAKLAVLGGEHAAVILDMEAASLAKTLAATRDLLASRSIPILVLTIHQNEPDVVAIFQAGADECLRPTVSRPELIARIDAMIRRNGGFLSARVEGSDEVDVVVGSLRISPTTRRATLDGRLLELSRREFDLLLTLARRPGHVFGRLDLQKALWGSHYYGKFSVNTYATRLRLKLGEIAEKPRFLYTVYGVGLKLHVPSGG
ncbi:response regulator transcription factor [Amycolatopsis sp. EV170708-02-1]|uniref:response regulator transcription factor n=1 Tax=Amycolatopsis sp. EV170708-02-1 TaxID=2919322 RepID=UPI001F0C9F61|nr:response regulator transcription factor [Amycolatopsis sp. EV170708-02-1]UMP07025.1 response regulator transcription factor [Amycolatopsis sp. EV170708-02-1]